VKSKKFVCFRKEVRHFEVVSSNWLMGGWLVGWMAGWLVGWLAGWLGGWVVLAGWMVG